MWIFTPTGFLSVVADRDHRRKGDLLVRSRVRGDLEAFRDRLPDPGAHPIYENAGSDYQFRMWVGRVDFVAGFASQVASLNYPNFKDACPADRHSPYLRIWSILRAAFDKRPSTWGQPYLDFPDEPTEEEDEGCYCRLLLPDQTCHVCLAEQTTDAELASLLFEPVEPQPSRLLDPRPTLERAFEGELSHREPETFSSLQTSLEGLP